MIDPARVRGALLEWFDERKRDLPWRRTGDPYAIWVSEVMLQQTTVTAVIPYWERFLERFPNVRALAEAPLDEVLRLWSGLGYYRRAKLLHRAARVVATDLDGELPSEPAALRAIPGIGPYTAGAVASIAFGVATPAIDGNVARVISRLRAIDGDPSKAATRRAIEHVAQTLVDPHRPGAFNEALMELGATVCRPTSPACEDCPLIGECAAFSQDCVSELPRKVSRRPLVPVVRVAVAVRDKAGSVLVERLPEDGVNGGLFELPSATVFHGSHHDGSPPQRVTRRFVESAQRKLEERGVAATLDEPLGRVKHGITHHAITLHVFTGELSAPTKVSSAWFDRETWQRSALTAAGRKSSTLLGLD